MSLRPLKKSDIGKDWVNGRREKRIRLQPEYHLIITEGVNTEPMYFDAIRRIVNEKYRDKIHLEVEGIGDNTLSLFEKARQRAANNPNEYKHVWVVYDTDDFPADHVNGTAALCDSASNEDTHFHAIWSNQCIELWFLLHFGFYHTDIHRSEYCSKLTEWLKKIGGGEYTKRRGDMYELLQPYMNIAIANAKKLDGINKGKLPSASAPGTKVYELVELLKPYLDVE